VAASREEIAALYAAAVVQGLALVTFPAASAVFTSPQAFGFSTTQYGMMFLPQVAMAILASSLASSVAARFSLKAILIGGLAFDLVSMLILALSALAADTSWAFPILCLATAALGLGFGATVTALNSYGESRLFPKGADRAVLTLNALLGLGTALAPVLVALCSALGAWWVLPVLMAIASAALLSFAVRLPFSEKSSAGSEQSVGRARVLQLPRRFWLFGAAALCYGIVETLCGTWGMLYLSGERGLSDHVASVALTTFWICVTLGRVMIAFVAAYVAPRLVYVVLPVLLALGLLYAGETGSVTGSITAFALLGFGCSALLPLTLSFAGSAFPGFAAVTAGTLLAIYQIGYGVAAFGVGPLERMADLSLGGLFSGASTVAILLALLALVINRRAVPLGGI
jgi:fucose permease